MGTNGSGLILPKSTMRRRSFLAGATALGVGATAVPGGLFAQWLPLYQLTEAEVRIIAATFHEVFPVSGVFGTCSSTFARPWARCRRTFSPRDTSTTPLKPSLPERRSM